MKVKRGSLKKILGKIRGQAKSRDPELFSSSTRSHAFYMHAKGILCPIQPARNGFSKLIDIM